jgi:hypothetical protein
MKEVAYRIERIVDKEDNILLHLREYDNPQQIMTFLLPRHLHPAFRCAQKINTKRSGEAAIMHLKYYGCTCHDGGEPIIRISGRKFHHIAPP